LFKRLASWFDSRTGYKHLVHEALDEPIPGGARWRYVFGSALTVTFMIQLVTGLLLMTSYSPSSSTAWGSVWYISHKMTAGWFIRGLHHFGSQAMVIVLLMHLIQVVLAGAYRAPREVNWWFGLALLAVTLGFSLTGYLLPWDQKGYWATRVATKIASGVPGVGPDLEKVIMGGENYGNQTLTRFYGLHVGVLPALLVMFLVAHIALFRKHGVTAPARSQGSEPFWPKQVFYDTLAGAVVLGVLAYMVWRENGAPLDAPADPGSVDYPARPEWYFLSLFQMLKKFPGKYEFVGTQVVPATLALVLLLLPLLEKALPRKLAHFVACMFIFAVVGGAGYLSVEALRADASDATFQKSREAADVATRRALLLAESPDAGITPSGSGDLLTHDPLTRGRAILEQKCLGCHAFGGKPQPNPDSPYKGFDLAHFASREWLGEFLDDPSAGKFLVRVPTAPGAKTSKPLTGMQTWKKTYDFEDRAERDRVVAFVASFARIPADRTVEDWVAEPRVKGHPGFAPFVEKCLPCHAVGNLGPSDKELRAPGLFAYGSSQWLGRMIKNPAERGLYGFKKAHEQMPGFADFTANDLEMLVRLLRDDYLGATPRSDSPQRVAPPN
jgi:ubiquinol-cytochrome c reductase cytochrome b subunit